ncbi:MAG: RIP metalloprotease RseP [Clostridiales bacterium]|nr:RIP metalloprotease RseP [Clostridiales bacterium]
MFTTIISFILVFGLLVIFHESGHFTLAKLNGIKVNEFSIGIGPKIYKKQKGETEYSVRAFPLGGFVKMEGEDEESENPRGFTNQTPLRRLSVIIAGPLMNFILAVILLSIIAFNIGMPTTTIDIVDEYMPAYTAGIQTGDKIIEIDGMEINVWQDVSSAIGDSSGDIEILLDRNGEKLTVSVTPTLEENTDRKIVGIIPTIEKSFFKSIAAGWNQMIFIFTSIFSFLKDLIVGNEVQGEVIGPIGIIGVVGQAADAGILSLLFIAAYLSINLGIINLLPFPALDGGRLIFILIELVRGKPVSPEREGFVHFIGFAILMALMVFVLFKDLIKLF